MITDSSYKYNKEPVYFCKDCGSLHIKVDSIGDYCFDCEGQTIGKAPMEV